ncbi:MAG: cytochrome b/b6 domain-containing protein [Cystobacterineae bacterium]|nr:cytochrome b/b6 domain-containing protein [Cystobacterineae bacterium]
MSKSQNSAKKFSLALRFFHWSGLLMMVVVYASVWMRKLYEKGTSERELMMSLHFGVSVLLLGWLVFRLIAYYASAKPPIVPPQPPWQAKALKLMHGVLWGLMLVMPLSGWLMINAKGNPVKIYSLGFELPTLIGKNDVLGKMLGESHGLVGMVFLAIIVLHSLIGLWHHFFKKDNALRRML